MSNVIDFSNWKKSTGGSLPLTWALTMTFDIGNVKNYKNTVTVDDVEKKLLRMTEYGDAKEMLKKFQLSSKS
jgi:hypothetical protein